MIGGKRGKGRTKKTGAARRRLPALFAALFFAPVLLCACAGPRVVFTAGLGKNEVFRIGSAVCTLPEILVYLTDARNQYENVYGPQVWELSLEGVTLEENVKETVLARTAQIKTMYLLALKKEVTLSDAEREKAQTAAAEYFQSMSQAEAERTGADQELLIGMYTEYALADKVYQYIIQDINPEISDDEARTITVQHIFLRTSVSDGAGNWVEYGEDKKAAVYEKAQEIREMAVSGEQDFVELASRYSEDAAITCSFGKGETEPAFEEAAFALETGEISQVVDSGGGYHIIKCVSTFDREQTDANKLQIVEERRREVFGQEYEAFVETLDRSLNEKLWKQAALTHAEETSDVGFFAVYEKYFP